MVRLSEVPIASRRESTESLVQTYRDRCIHCIVNPCGFSRNMSVTWSGTKSLKLEATEFTDHVPDMHKRYPKSTLFCTVVQHDTSCQHISGATILFGSVVSQREANSVATPNSTERRGEEFNPRHDETHVQTAANPLCQRSETRNLCVPEVRYREAPYQEALNKRRLHDTWLLPWPSAWSETKLLWNWYCRHHILCDRGSKDTLEVV